MINNVRTTGQLGPLLKQLRNSKGLSQLELGKKIGLSQERISVIENHPERASVNQLLTVLMVLDAELQIKPRIALYAKEVAHNVTKGNLETKSQDSW